MFLPARASILPREAAGDRQPEVPLWAFVVMTVFSIVLMAFVILLLWRPDIFRSSHQRAAQVEIVEHEGKPSKEQQATQLLSRAGSLSRPWFRSGGSFRSNINRWRSGVDRDESPYPSSGDEDWPVCHNYAPPPPRPISHMQQIPEQYESSIGDGKSARADQRR